MSVERQTTVARAVAFPRRIFAIPFPLWMLTPLLAGPAVAGAADGRRGTDFVELHVARLSCVIGNNLALGTHAAGYNGIFRMAAPEQSQSPYVPFYAGINLENFFDARPRHPERKVFFEPRSWPLTLKRLDDTTIELDQAATPYFGIESHLRFQLKPPYYIDYQVDHPYGLEMRAVYKPWSGRDDVRAEVRRYLARGQ